MPNKFCRCEDRNVQQMENYKDKGEKFPYSFWSKPEHPVHHPHLSQGGTWGSGVGCNDLASVTLQLQVLVPCLTICYEHKELHGDPEAKAAKAECAASVGDTELKEVGCLERKRRLQMTENRCCVGNTTFGLQISGENGFNPTGRREAPRPHRSTHVH